MRARAWGFNCASGLAAAVCGPALAFGPGWRPATHLAGPLLAIVLSRMRERAELKSMALAPVDLDEVARRLEGVQRTVDGYDAVQP